MSEVHSWVIIKFGGKSVADRACWDTIAGIADKHLKQGKKPVIVCSALTRISDKLETLLDDAVIGSYDAILDEIRFDHYSLGKSLGLDTAQLLQPDFDELKQLVTGVSLVKEASARVRAQVMAFGELMLTKLGAAYLQSQSVRIAWKDSRQFLVSREDGNVDPESNYTKAKCDYEKDERLIQALASEEVDVLILQGFIASNPRGETVLLGRGGSDTSAAYFAAKLAATRCEIWTDVPGIYTANPHLIPTARRIKTLAYDEAQEIASLGGKVLHPHSIFPVQQKKIPLYVGYTLSPEREGTLISDDGRYANVPIKAILTKYEILLISIDAVSMWQQVGFLSDIFECFKKHGLSVDLISTSESNVTVSLDFKAHRQDSRAIDALLEDLNKFSNAGVIGPCAQVSLVGHNIRSIIHQLGEVFEVFEEQKVYLISQAANDLNLTFVVDEAQAERLAVKLHALLIEGQLGTDYMDKSWQEEFDKQEEAQPVSHWWHSKKEALTALAGDSSPVYVYDIKTVQSSVDRLLGLKSVDQIFYAMKANNQEDVLRCLFNAGIGFECVSEGELSLILSLFPEIDPARIMFTPNFAWRDEYAFALSKNVVINLDNLHPLTHWPELFKNRDVFLRIDSGEGAGHHKYVCTAGSESKFGISPLQFDELFAALDFSGANVVGLHCHSGSGILEPGIWGRVAEFLSDLIVKFPKVKTLDLGGGLGVVEKPGQKPLNLKALDDLLLSFKVSHPDIALWLEPGRYLVASAGVLLTTVTQIKQKGQMHFIGINTGMNSLIRPALYGSYHEIINLTRLDEPLAVTANIVGPICESSDTLGYSRKMPLTQEGDVILIGTAGAYGRVMATQYNLRKPAAEHTVINDDISMKV